MAKSCEIQEFFVEGNDSDASHVLLHITEPSTPEEIRKGYFFALAEINNGNIEQISHLQQMIDDLESGYFETENSEDKDSFEITLEYINRRGHHILENSNSNISCIVGSLSNGHLSFAYYGKPSVNIFYQGKTGLESMDLIGSAENTNINQLFSSLTQGDMNIGDILYISTPYTEKRIPRLRTKEILGSRNIKQSSLYIEQTLREVKDGLSYGGIFFEVSEEKIEANENLETVHPSTIMQNKKEAERNTINSTKILHQTREKMKAYKEAKKEQKKEIRKSIQAPSGRSQRGSRIETNFRPRNTDTTDTVGNTILITIGRAVVGSIISILKLLKNILLTLGKNLINLILIITNKGGQRAMVLDSYTNWWGDKKRQIGELPLLTKLLFVITIISAVVFVSSIGYMRTREKIELENQQQENIINSAKDKKEEADGLLIYGNDTEALSLIQEAKDILSTLPEDSKTYATEKEALEKDIEATLLSLKKLTIVAPTVLVDLNNTGTGSINTSEITKAGDNLIAFGPLGNYTYKVNINSTNIETKEQSSVHRLFRATKFEDSDNLLFLSGEKEVSIYNTDPQTISEQDISFPTGDETTIVDLALYNSRLYTLHPEGNQIYKHNQTQTGYDKGTPWITQRGVNLEKAVSLAVDGSIYVLNSDGSILNFKKGSQESFAVSNLEPKLDNPRQIWTNLESDKLYILEPTNKRVVVLTKEGRLVQQYSAETWQNPAGMVVEDDGKTIYILDQNKIYKFQI